MKPLDFSPVRPEPVEGLPFFFALGQERTRLRQAQPERGGMVVQLTLEPPLLTPRRTAKYTGIASNSSPSPHISASPPAP